MWKPHLNPALGVPIYRQIMDSARIAVAAGVLSPGEQLPSIRELSSDLRINPSSAVKAYNELRHSGLILQDQGRGSFVHPDPTIAVRTRREVVEQTLRAAISTARSVGTTDAELMNVFEDLLTVRTAPGGLHARD